MGKMLPPLDYFETAATNTQMRPKLGAAKNLSPTSTPDPGHACPQEYTAASTLCLRDGHAGSPYSSASDSRSFHAVGVVGSDGNIGNGSRS